MELSTYRSSGIAANELWVVCATHVDSADMSRVAKARGSCKAQVLTNAGLNLDPNGRPHDRHVDVIKWPIDKDALKALQQEIAAAMTLHLKPS
jgi:hypothetical protein